MISSLSGTIRDLRSEKATVEVAGVGYQILVTPKTSAELAVGNDVFVYTSMVVREDSMTLYGFLDADERDLFELLQTVSGIGPKVSLAITGSLSVDEFASAVSKKDTKTLSSVPGIGSKGAQRMILELGTKLVHKEISNASKQIGWRDQLIAALTNLGFTLRDAEIAVNELAATQDPKYLANLKPSDALKLALAQTKSGKGIAK